MYMAVPDQAFQRAEVPSGADCALMEVKLSPTKNYTEQQKNWSPLFCDFTLPNEGQYVNNNRLAMTENFSPRNCDTF